MSAEVITTTSHVFASVTDTACEEGDGSGCYRCYDGNVITGTESRPPDACNLAERNVCVHCNNTALVSARTAKSLAVSVWTATTLDVQDATQLEGMSS